MRLAIFGATGRTGQALAEVALAHGDDVRALVRGAASPWIRRARERLTVVRGDPRSDATIAQTIDGVDVVCCVFGPRSARDAPFCAELTRRIVAAMAAARIRRLVCVTGATVGDMPRNTSAALRALRAATALARRAQARDRAEQEALVAASDTDWTIVKPARLTDAPRSGAVHAGPSVAIGLGSSIGRRDLADFVHRVAAQDRYLRRRVYVRD